MIASKLWKVELIIRINKYEYISWIDKYILHAFIYIGISYFI